MSASGHAPFAIWNRSGNRLVTALLRSPLHRTVSGRLALITVTGRLSGREHTLPVAYTQDGTQLTVPVMWPARKRWWRNLRDGAPVRIRLRGQTQQAWAQALSDAAGNTFVRVDLEPAGKTARQTPSIR